MCQGGNLASGSSRHTGTRQIEQMTNLIFSADCCPDRQRLFPLDDNPQKGKACKNSSIQKLESQVMGRRWGEKTYYGIPGDAEGTRGTFTMTGGSLAYTATRGPCSITNPTGVIALKGVNITAVPQFGTWPAASPSGRPTSGWGPISGSSRAVL